MSQVRSIQNRRCLFDSKREKGKSLQSDQSKAVSYSSFETTPRNEQFITNKELGMSVLIQVFNDGISYCDVL